jgi:hypothetical protein
MGGAGVLGRVLRGVATRLLGEPGCSTGGPVSGGRGYVVGERGPEYFVPGTSGRIERMGGGGGARDVRVAISIASPQAGDPGVLRQSSRQVARAVKSALRNA